MTLPRIRGRVGQASADSPEHAGKWFFELSIWDLTGEHQIGDSWDIGPWETEEIALQELKRGTRLVAETMEKAATGRVSGTYLDLKNGAVLRPWVEQ